MNIVSTEEIESEFKRLTGQDNISNYCFAVQPRIIEDRQFDMELLNEVMGGELQYA